MRSARQTFDIFLSHGGHDAGVADVVRRALESAGLSVFTASDLKPGVSVADQLQEKLAESLAVVVILSQPSLRSDYVAFEIGGAAGWNKPIYLLLHGMTSASLPPYLRRFRSMPVTRHAEMVRELALRPGKMSDDEIEGLRDVYAQVGVPVDGLATAPRALDRLTNVFNRKNRSSRLSEDLLRELLRLRKRGKLPRLGRNGSKVA